MCIYDEPAPAYLLLRLCESTLIRRIKPHIDHFKA